MLCLIVCMGRASGVTSSSIMLVALYAHVVILPLHVLVEVCKDTLHACISRDTTNH